MALTKILLYGHLRKQFGKCHEFDIASPAEAVRALKANYPTFYSALLKHKPGYHVFVGTETIGEEQLLYPSSSAEVIKIVPVVAGSGRLNPFLLIIAAIAIIATAGAAGAYAATYLGAGSAFFTASAATAFIGNIGTALLLTGVSSLLTSSPKTEQKAESFFFQGAENTAGQGGAVPLGYGRMRVGSVTLSSGLYVRQKAPVVSQVPTAPITGPIIEGPVYADGGY